MPMPIFDCEEMTFLSLVENYEALWMALTTTDSKYKNYLDQLMTNALVDLQIRILQGDEKAKLNFLKFNLIALYCCFSSEAFDYLMHHHPDSALNGTIQVIDNFRQEQLHEHDITTPIITHVTTNVLFEASLQLDGEINTAIFEQLNTPPEIMQFIENNVSFKRVTLH